MPLKTRKARRSGVAVVAAALVALAATLTVASFTGTIPERAAKAAESFLGMMDNRSPGGRNGDVLTKIKGESLPLAEMDPAPVVGPLSTIDDFAVEDMPPLPPDFLAPPLPVDSPVVIFADWGPGTGASDPPPFCCGVGGPPQWPGWPGSPRVPGPPGPPGPPGHPTPGVPEPATWGMMLFGFGMIGWLSRHRKARSIVKRSVL